MKLLGFLAAATLAVLSFAPAGAATEYLLTIENPSAVTYAVDVHDVGKIHSVSLATGKTVSLNVGTQTPKVTITGGGCTATATPSIKTYVTLALAAGCKITTKAAGISGF